MSREREREGERFECDVNVEEEKSEENNIIENGIG
jgi:hypothetical protein